MNPYMDVLKGTEKHTMVVITVRAKEIYETAMKGVASIARG